MWVSTWTWILSCSLRTFLFFFFRQVKTRSSSLKSGALCLSAAFTACSGDGWYGWSTSDPSFIGVLPPVVENNRSRFLPAHHSPICLSNCFIPTPNRNCANPNPTLRLMYRLIQRYAFVIPVCHMPLCFHWRSNVKSRDIVKIWSPSLFPDLQALQRTIDFGWV